jgi:hypothetical protein
MASIARRRGSAIWTAFFRDENGRQHCRSTKVTNKRQAQRIADGYERARIGVAQAVVGHDSEAARAMYVGVGQEAFRPTVNALPGPDNEKLTEEHLKVNRLVNAWKDLLERVEAGNNVALYQLVRCILSGATLLQEIAVSGDAEILKELRQHARWEKRWPIMKSPHPEFDADEKRIFGLLQLGADLDFLLGSEARAKHHGPLAELTLDLLAEVNKEVWFHRATDPGKVLGSDQMQKRREQQPQWTSEAAKLPKLCKDSGPMWWKFIAQLFEQRWPELSKNPELLKLGGKKESAGRFKNKLKERVRQKLMSLAPK